MGLEVVAMAAERAVAMAAAEKEAVWEARPGRGEAVRSGEETRNRDARKEMARAGARRAKS